MNAIRMLRLTYTASGNVFCFIIAVNNTTGVTSGAGTAYLRVHLSSPLVFSVVHVARSFVFCVLFCKSLSCGSHRYILVFEH